MGENEDFAAALPDSKASYVLSNVAEVVERILTFVPTKALMRIWRYLRLGANDANDANGATRDTVYKDTDIYMNIVMYG